MKNILAAVLAILLGVQMIPAEIIFAEDAETVTEETQKEDAQTEEAQEAKTEELELSARSGILMEASTGKVIYEKSPDEQLAPASVTKVMTLLLIFDAIRDGKVKLEDEVTVSEYASSMGGSQVFLEAGEKQTVDTMIKCITVASGNDACVA